MRSVLALLLLAVNSIALAAVDAALVGQASTSTNTVTTASGTTQTSGSKFVVALAYDASVTVSTVTDSKSNTYTKRGSTHEVFSRVEFWACDTCSGGASHTAQADFSGAAFGTAYLIEVTDAATGNAVDQTGGGADNATPYTVTLGALAQADEVVLSIISSSAGAPTYASGDSTVLGNESDGGTYWTSAVSKVVVASTTGPTVSWTGGNADTVLAAISVKQSGGGGGGSSALPIIMQQQ